MKWNLRNISIVFFSCCLLLFATSARAQFDAQFNQYFYNHTYANPAAVGEAKMMQISLIQRIQWVGIHNAPITTDISIHTPFPLRKRPAAHAVGMQLISDVLGIFANQYITAQYAYKFKLGNGIFSVGASLGAVNVICYGDSVHISESEYHTQNDPAVPTGKKSGVGFDAGAGVWYSTDQWYAGVAATHITGMKIHLGEHAVFHVMPLITFAGGYNIYFRNNQDYILATSGLAVSDFRSWDFHATALLLYKNKFWGGLSVRRTGLGLIFGTNFFRGFTIGYAYELPVVGQLLRHTSGSHEIYLGYEFNLFGGNKNRAYKSVRYL